MTDRHPHRREILGAMSAGILAMAGGCYLIVTDDSDEDVNGDRDENETSGNETTPDLPQEPDETNLTTNPDLNTTYPDDDC